MPVPGFLLVQGVHHDEYDNWNSRYQQWNSVHLSPHRDLLAEWQAAVRAQGMRYGVTFHHEYSWWWYQSARPPSPPPPPTPPPLSR